LREERRLKVFEYSFLRKMFGPKKDEVTGEWRRLNSGELYDVCSTPNDIGVIRSKGMR
jgi:hypothetical protein